MRRPVSKCVGFWLALTLGAPVLADESGINSPAFKEKLQICAACHSPDGISAVEGVPNIAGEPELFTQWQLVYFRGETRKNELMTPAAKDLTDQDIRDLGTYFLSLTPATPLETDSNPELTKAGARLEADRHCNQCHLDHFEGQGETPRLAAQREEYVVKALHDYQQGARRGRGNVIMPEIAYSLSEDDIKALAHYMSRQAPN
jgi:cytochrome c553